MEYVKTMVNLTKELKDDAKQLSYKAIGETNLSGFIRFLIKEYKNKKS